MVGRGGREDLGCSQLDGNAGDTLAQPRNAIGGVAQVWLQGEFGPRLGASVVELRA